MTRFAPLLFLPLLAACAVPGQIVTEDAFRQTVVGRELILGPDVTFTINADKTITGDVQGMPATGTWSFEDGFWCRTITVSNVVNDDCQRWVVEGEELVITRERGTGETFRYRRAGE